MKRETGLLALRGAEELVLSVESAKELQRVDAEEFARASAQKSEGLLSVFRFLKPEFTLNVRAETVRPQIEAIVRNNVRVSTDQMNISSMIDYTIKRAGVFALKTVLPAGYRVEQVTGNNILQWNERNEGDARLLEVTLKERMSGAYSLQIELGKNLQRIAEVAGDCRRASARYGEVDRFYFGCRRAGCCDEIRSVRWLDRNSRDLAAGFREVEQRRQRRSLTNLSRRNQALRSGNFL